MSFPPSPFFPLLLFLSLPPSPFFPFPPVLSLHFSLFLPLFPSHPSPSIPLPSFLSAARKTVQNHIIYIIMVTYDPSPPPLLPSSPPPLSQISSLLGVVWFIGLYLTVFSYQLQIPSYSGVIAIFILMFILFAFPLPFLYYRSRIWLAKELVRVT